MHGDGTNVRSYLSVHDFAAAILLLIEASTIGEVYNVGGDAERQNIQVVKVICALLDQRRPRADGQPHATAISFVTDRPGHDHRYAIDARRARTELGWAPQEDFQSGLRKTVRWYLDHPAWIQGILDGLSKKLPVAIASGVAPQ